MGRLAKEEDGRCPSDIQRQLDRSMYTHIHRSCIFHGGQSFEKLRFEIIKSVLDIYREREEKKK